MESSPFHHSQQYWLQLLVGPSASSLEYFPNSSRTREEARLYANSTSWLYIFTIALLLGGQCLSGGWDAVFAELERFVVPFYTALVLLYLFILTVAGPLESLYQWLFVSQTRTKKRRGPSVAPPTALDDQERAKTTPSLPTPSPVSAPAVVEDDQDAIHASQPFDLSGAYKLVRNDNFEGFLAVQGVPWALRRAANQARPIHRITHRGSQLTIKIEGIIESQTTYIINGPPVETNVRGRIFQDVVHYLPEEDGRGIRVSKTALSENYDVTVTRVLSPDMQEITMTSRAVFHDGREPVQSVQKFQRMEE